MTLDEFYLIALLHGCTRRGDVLTYNGPMGHLEAEAGGGEYQLAYHPGPYAGRQPRFLTAGYLSDTSRGAWGEALRRGIRLAEGEAGEEE